MTNFEKLKNMCVNEMVDKLDKVFNCNNCPIEGFCSENRKVITCKSVWKKWLKSEAENND